MIKKQWTALCLSLLLLLTTATAQAKNNEEIELSGRCGAYCYWLLKGDTLIVGGIGSVGNFGESPSNLYYSIDEQWNTPLVSHTKVPWDPYRSKIQNIYVEEGVTNFFDVDFNFYTKLAYLYLPKSITDLGTATFKRSSNLRQIHYAGSKGELHIADDVAKAIKRVSVRYESVKTPDIFTGFYDRALEAKNNLYATGSAGENIRWELKNRILHIEGTGDMLPIPSDGLSYIDPIINHPYGQTGSFYAAPWGYFGDVIQQVVIGEGVESVFVNAFHECRELQTLYLPASVKRVATAAFAAIPNLQTLHYGGNGPAWEQVQFEKDADKQALLRAGIYYESKAEPYALHNYESESPASGWIMRDGKWSYQNEAGNKQTGWIEVDGFWWCLDKDGIWMPQAMNTPPADVKKK